MLRVISTTINEAVEKVNKEKTKKKGTPRQIAFICASAEPKSHSKKGQYGLISIRLGVSG